MNIQQIKQISDNAPDWAIEVCQMGVNSGWFRFYDGTNVYEEKLINLVDDNVYPFTMSINCLRNQLALHEENEKLRAAISNSWWHTKQNNSHYCNFCHANLNYSDHVEGCVIEELSND